MVLCVLACLNLIQLHSNLNTSSSAMFLFSHLISKGKGACEKTLIIKQVALTTIYNFKVNLMQFVYFNLPTSIAALYPVAVWSVAN